MDSSEIKKPKRVQYETHRWTCDKDCFKWFLDVDNSNPFSIMAFEHYSMMATMHVMKFQHTITHTQKETGNIRRI